MDAPLCACGCRKPVKRSKHRGQTWFKYASRTCANRGLARNRPLSGALVSGHARLIQEQREARHGRMLAVLRDFSAHRLTLDAAALALIELQYVEYRRGNNTGYRRGLRDARLRKAS